MLDLDKGAEFLDLESGREMLVKNRGKGVPTLFYKENDSWVYLRAATEEDMALLDAAYQEAMSHQRARAETTEQPLPLEEIKL